MEATGRFKRTISGDDYGPRAGIDLYRQSAILHFLTEGAERDMPPNAYFDYKHYASSSPDAFGSNLDALHHFISVGDAERRQPSSAFGRDDGRSGEVGCDPGRVAETPEALQLAAESIAQKLRLKHERRPSKFETRDVRPVRCEDPLSALEKLEFPAPGRVRFTVLVACFNEFDLTVECLASVAASKLSRDYVVVLADDGPTDPRMCELSEIPNIVWEGYSVNRHYLTTCNAAFAKCEGDYLLLLNNDGQVTEDCIESLCDALDGDPGLGAAAPKILYPNGRLQEAGCAIRANGESVMVGVGEDPALPQYNFDRDVSYASASCLWEVNSRRPNFKFPIENLVGDTLSEAVPDGNWVFPEALNSQASLLSKSVISKSPDPVAVCDKMIDLFTSLRTHFAAQRPGGAEEAKDGGETKQS